ncbi:hypothetical protein PC129_g13211 [Phytophthora cactorum]|uniref:Phospholipase D-like domain-containing protein n=2 Tax=Phytophthora cactorum TaxID=29920 RepID=A0A8T1HVC0_9STRA|nr:hypothetical protein PC129_g13211 [Phytophthora cactorum]
MLVEAAVPVYNQTCMMHYKLLTLTYADTIFASAGSANLTAVSWIRNDEFLVQTKSPPAYQAQALFELIFENSVKTNPDVDLTPTKGSNHGSEPTIPEFDSQDTDGWINTMDTQSSVYTQDTQDELHVMTPDGMNTSNGTQDSLDSNDLHVVTPDGMDDMEDVEAALEVAVNMVFQYSQTRDTILSDAGYSVYAQPDRSPDTVVSMGMQYSGMGGYDLLLAGADLNVEFDANVAVAIMNDKKDAAANLLYQIKIASARVGGAPGVSTKSLERTGIIPLHDRPVKLAKNSQEKDQITDEPKKRGVYLARMAEQREILEATKAERLHRAYIHSSFIKEALEETESTAWRLALQKKSAREQRRTAFFQQLMNREEAEKNLTFSPLLTSSMTNRAFTCEVLDV